MADTDSMPTGSFDLPLARESFLAWFQRGGGRRCGLPETRAWAEHAWAHMLPPVLPQKPRQWSRSYWQWKVFRGTAGVSNSLASHESDIRAQVPVAPTAPDAAPVERPEQDAVDLAGRRVSRTMRSGVRLTVDGRWAVVTDVVKHALGMPPGDERDVAVRRMTWVGARELGAFPNATGGAKHRIVALTNVDALLGHMMDELHSGHLYLSVKAYREGAACKALVGVESPPVDRASNDKSAPQRKRRRRNETPRTRRGADHPASRRVLSPVSSVPGTGNTTAATTAPVETVDLDETEDESAFGLGAQTCASARSGESMARSDDDMPLGDAPPLGTSANPPSAACASPWRHSTLYDDQISARHCEESAVTGLLDLMVDGDSRPDDLAQEAGEDDSALGGFCFILGDDDPLSDREDIDEDKCSGDDDSHTDDGRAGLRCSARQGAGRIDRTAPVHVARDAPLRQQKRSRPTSDDEWRDESGGGADDEYDNMCGSPLGSHVSDSDCYDGDEDDDDYQGGGREIESRAENVPARRLRRRPACASRRHTGSVGLTDQPPVENDTKKRC